MKKTDFVRELLRESTDLNKKFLSLLFHVARSSMIYASLLDIRDKKAKSILETLHREHPWYGHRRVGWTLGWCMNKTRRLMKKFGIHAKVRKRRSFIKKDDQNTENMHGVNPESITGIPGSGTKILNYLTRLSPIAPNIVWRSDFTHVIYKGIHLYLATILDDYTKEIIGYALSYRHTKEFILVAIQDAITKTG